MSKLFTTKANQDKEKINELISVMISVDSTSFNFVSRKGFTKLLGFIKPNYKIPHRTWLSKHHIPRLYDNVRSDIISQLENQDYISITSDGW